MCSINRVTNKYWTASILHGYMRNITNRKEDEMTHRAETRKKRGPLEGVVVADFSRVLAGPYCTMLLADMGATVIKIESPAGDDTRQWMPPAREGVSTYFLSVNRNKQSIVLDLKEEEDLKTAHAIVDRADVLVENFKPGGLVQYGLDVSQTSERWPDLIHASITGFGTKEGANLPGYDLLVQALSGFMHVTGSPDGPPQRAGVAIFDVVTGLHTAVGILAALYERATRGQGQRVETNLLSAALSALVNQTTGFVTCDNEPVRLGNDHPSLFPYGPFKAKDGELIICCGNNSQFDRLMETIGASNVSKDARYTTVMLRNKNREALRREINRALKHRTVEEWFELLRAVGVPSAPVETIGGGVKYAESLGLEPIALIAEGEQQIPTISNPVTFSRTPVDYRTIPPELNENAEDIRRWLDETS